MALVSSLPALQLNSKSFLGGRSEQHTTLAATEALGKQPDWLVPARYGDIIVSFSI